MERFIIPNKICFAYGLVWPGIYDCQQNKIHTSFSQTRNTSRTIFTWVYSTPTKENKVNWNKGLFYYELDYYLHHKMIEELE